MLMVVWNIYVTGFGPTKMLAASLEAENRAALERDFIAIPTTDVITSSMARCRRESRSAPSSRAYPRILPIGEPPPSRLPGEAKDSGVPG